MLRMVWGRHWVAGWRVWGAGMDVGAYPNLPAAYGEGRKFNEKPAGISGHHGRL